jgi:hypothetical protein
MAGYFNSELPPKSDYGHAETLQAALDSIVDGMKERFKTIE